MNNAKELYIDSVQFNYYNGPQLLTGAYLECRTGEIVGLLGRNGSGKSTFLKIIFGSLRAQNSYILINGKKVNKAFLTNKIGYLPQDSYLPTHEKVAYLIQLLVQDRYQMQILLLDPLIITIKDRKIYQLSGGELRYLEICLLLYQPTDFLLLDEPFTGLEPIHMERIGNLILSFKNKKGFVISDHNYRHVLEITSSIFLLVNGACRRLRHKRELEFFYVKEGTFDDD
ncbi:ATP-binding cassette domain-containing protein [Sphingobacterium griseoflavum]|uniref:ABC transporter ATP-binding protein n=1 Tax=Sphingobacterium griseoflavum TaxID=1474952 RepID=A0ABQ3HU37_9SPHI|nr:ATP-binding cassette domain-containing protein [Sphingobacterium griseoflavum]GHE23312.1 ABC transporter ATP-binding protein [Sphingobacterium griseoflavum]